MFRSRRLVLRFAAAAIGLAAVFGGVAATEAASATTPSQLAGVHQVPSDKELAVTARVAHPKSTVDDRSERTSPVLLFWVAALLALLLVLQARTARTGTSAVPPTHLRGAGRFVRGPPASLIAS